MKRFLYSAWEIIEIGLIALVAVFVVRSFLVQPFLVSGTSMEPNFSSGDYLLIDEITYHFRAPERGEVIVFHYPGNEKTFYIKRIIGLPGERLVFQDGKVKIFNKDNPNGFVLDEKYLPGETTDSNVKEATLKDGEYFMMGDNRHYSFDSRSWGSLKSGEIIGLVRWRLWPISKAVAVAKPSY